MTKALFWTKAWSLVSFTKTKRLDIDKGFYEIMGKGFFELMGNQNSTPNMHNLGLLRC